MSYAVFMFVSGMVAERVNLRNFLSFGMITSGIFTILFGLGRYWQIHSLAYYIAIQVTICKVAFKIYTVYFMFFRDDIR